MLRFEESENQVARIKVVGIGGGGSNVVDHMVGLGIQGVEYAVINTDAQALAKSVATEKIQIGKKITRGMGTGGNPELGRQAALDDKELLNEMIEGVDILFIASGFGGGTGTGAAPVIAQVAHDKGALTVGIITKPFTFEGPKRMAQAEKGVIEFRETVDTIISIPNDKLFDMISQDTPLYEAYRLTDQIVYQAVESISQIIAQPGLINLDFADIKAILSIKGGAIIGFGEGSGKDKAVKAIQTALSNPLLETKDIRGAKGILISIVGGKDLSLYEVNNAIGSVHEIADEDAHILIGAIVQDELKDKALVTLIATGLDVELYERYSRPEPVFHIPLQEEQAEPDVESDPAQAAEEEPAVEEEELTISAPYNDSNEEEEQNEEPEQAAEEDEPQEEEELLRITPAAPVVSERHASQHPQQEFFEKTDPTVYQGTNLDIPAFMRKKKTFAGRE